MRSIVKYKIFLLICFLFANGCEKQSDNRLTVAAPFGPLAYPLVYMHQKNPDVELVIWQNPEQLRAMVAGNQADLFAVPTNVAALFYNRGQYLRMLDISLWKVFWVVSSDSTITSFNDLRGKEVAIPFRGNMPHILFDILAEKSGLDIDTEITIRFVNTPLDAVQLMLTGNVDNAVLSEPDISVMLYRANQSGKTDRSYYRAIDLQEQWAQAFDTTPEIPLGGIALGNNLSSDDERISLFLRNYAQALDTCSKNPHETALRVADFFEHIPAEAIESSLMRVQPHSIPAYAAKSQIEKLFTILDSVNPALIGDALPDDGFYIKYKEALQ